MPNGDDLDQRFNELVSQVDVDEQRKMRAAAKKGAKTHGSKRLSSQDTGLGRETWRPEWEAAPRPRRRVGKAWVAMAAIVAVLSAASLFITMRPDLFRPSGPSPGDTFELSSLDRAHPFEGSPAAGHAEGIAGFVMPEAKALGGLSEKEVAKGLERTRELLSAAFLDKKTLLGGEPDAFAKLLHPDQRKWFREGLDDRDTTRTMVNSFAPGTAELLTDVIKVNGRATLGTFKEDDLRGVSVKLNYLVTYAVQHPDRPLTAMRLVMHPEGEVHMYRLDDEIVVWVHELGASATPARCDTDDGYVHPFYDDSPPDKVGPTGMPSDPYDLDQPQEDGCSTAGTT